MRSRTSTRSWRRCRTSCRSGYSLINLIITVSANGQHTSIDQCIETFKGRTVAQIRLAIHTKKIPVAFCISISAYWQIGRAFILFILETGDKTAEHAHVQSRIVTGERRTQLYSGNVSIAVMETATIVGSREMTIFQWAFEVVIDFR